MKKKINIIIDVCRTIAPLILWIIAKYFGFSGIILWPLVGWIIFAFSWLIIANFIIDQNQYPFLAYIPTSLDTLSITAVSFCTGMVNTPIITNYFVTTTVCSTNLKIKQGLFCCLFSIFCYVSVSFLVYWEVLPYINIFDSATQITIFNLICAVILISVGLICTHIIVTTIAREKEREKKMAEDATRAKSQFLANMSHEIRTPMNGVIAAADLALAEKLSPMVERYLKIIHSSGYSLLSIINDILDFSKIEAGKLEIEETPFKINELMDKITHLFVNKTNEKKIEFLVDIEPHTPMAVIGDPLRLQQIITNLVGNALKFTDPGGIVTIGVSTESQAADSSKQNTNYVHLKFFTKDSGIGMKSEYLAKLFEPFSQEDASTTRKYGGTGLGLSISQKLVEMMGGTIWAESEPGVGTTFYFTICTERQPVEQEIKLELPNDLKDKSVMVVDDCTDSLDIIAKTLVAFGLKVTTASFGKDALREIANSKAHHQPFDLITLDWIMPEMEGIEVARHIRNELNLTTPIVMLTAFGQEAEKVRAQNVGINAFLTKPVSPSALYESILEVFGKKEDLVRSKKTAADEDLSNLPERFEGFRVLVVEDNLTNQKIAEAILKKAKIISVFANNGQDAVKKVYSMPFDLVLMDIQMPLMDGYEATRFIRKDPRFKDLPIIAMTAHAMRGDAEKCFAAGMNDHATKPVNQKTLFQTLWKHLASRTPTPEAKQHSNTEAVPNETQVAEEHILSLPGIDIQHAMYALQLDWETFKHILVGFHHHTQAVYDTLEHEFENENMAQIREIVHSLRGSSANIGAQRLQEKSSVLESALINNQTKEEIDPLMKELRSALDQVLMSISMLAGKKTHE